MTSDCSSDDSMSTSDSSSESSESDESSDGQMDTDWFKFVTIVEITLKNINCLKSYESYILLIIWYIMNIYASYF